MPKQLDATFPGGTQRLYQALRDAGIPADPQRNVPWINTTPDGAVVLNVWRRYLEVRGNKIVADIDARKWERGRIAKSKARAVVNGLEQSDGAVIRVVVIEEHPLISRKCIGARCDSSWWLVKDTGTDFRLWRGRKPRRPSIPATPTDFGHVAPIRRERVSTQIERDPLVKCLTLERAGNRCEISGCRDNIDFRMPEVHHVTHLGAGGADHTYNTVALCPACHARVHRGTAAIQQRLKVALSRILKSRGR